MFKRRTSRVRQRRQVRVLRANVMSPRIFWYDFRNAVWACMKLAVILALIGVAGWAVWRGVERGLLENEEFQLQQIVLNENPALDEIRLLEITQIDLQGSLFDCDPAAIRECLIGLPEIAEVEVTRDFPGTLEIRVETRKPFVWVASKSQGIPPRDLARGMLVDRNGQLFRCTRGMFADASKLPVIELRESGTTLVPGTLVDHPDYVRGLRLYAEALEVAPDAVDWIDTIRQHKAWGSKLITRDKLEATFGHEEIERQMTDLFAAMDHARLQGDRIATIQLIGKRNLPVTFHEKAPPRAIPVPEADEASIPSSPGDADVQQLLIR